MKVRDFGSCKEVLSNQYALSLYTLAESVQATKILEIGAGWGWSSRAFALSLENRLPAKLVSVDVNPDRIHRENSRVVLDARVNWVIMDTDSAKVKVHDEFDVLYIDGNPYMAQADFLRFYPSVRPGGLVVMDGYGGQLGPTEAVDSLKSSYPFIDLPYHAGCAHAVHRKPRPFGKKKSFKATCENCVVFVNGMSWHDIDEKARKHVLKESHNVHVQIEHRNLSYTLFAKGAV